jgi:excisionase family DNA binding protein
VRRPYGLVVYPCHKGTHVVAQFTGRIARVRVLLLGAPALAFRVFFCPLGQLKETLGKLEAREEPLSRGAPRSAERQGGRPEKHYSVNEAADLLGMHPETLRREIRAGNIRVEKLGARRTRIAESEHSRFVRERAERYGRP